MSKKYRIVNKTRFFIFSTLVLIVLLFAISQLFKNTAHSIESQANYQEILVEEGDTLWNIVSKHMPNSKNKQRTVYEVSRLNNLGNSNIYPGDLILLPIK